MLSVNELHGVHVRASDGAIGDIEEVYFDDERWTIRYLVVDATALLGRQVLISPISVRRVDTDAGTMEVLLTTDQVRHSPKAYEHRPVSRQYERTYGQYYGYLPYWIGPGYWGGASYPAALARQPVSSEPDAPPPAASEADSHLRSSREVTGYHIQARDGDIGHVDDFLADPETWNIRFLRLDTSNFIGGKAVLVPTESFGQVSWRDRKIQVDLTREQIRNSPEYHREDFRLGGEQRVTKYYQHPH